MVLYIPQSDGYSETQFHKEILHILLVVAALETIQALEGEDRERERWSERGREGGREDAKEREKSRMKGRSHQ